MLKRTAVTFGAILFLSTLSIHAQDQDQDETVQVSSCSLFVKATVYPVDLKADFGRAKIQAVLCDEEKKPLANREIQLTATCGMLFCAPPDSLNETSDSSAHGTCLITGEDGTMTAYLVNIPFNTRGRVLAACLCGNSTIKASSSFIINRSVIRKKKPKRTI